MKKFNQFMAEPDNSMLGLEMKHAPYDIDDSSVTSKN